MTVQVLLPSDQEIVVVAPRGELDMATSPALRRALHEASEKGLGVVVDLAAVTFMDSCPLGVLLTANRHLRASGRKLVLINASARIMAMLTLAGVARILDVHGQDGHGGDEHGRKGEGLEPSSPVW